MGKTPHMTGSGAGHLDGQGLGTLLGERALVLASGSSARAALLDGAGVVFEVDRPEVDERSWDHLLGQAGPSALALHLAGLKATAVASHHPGSVVLAADQVGVVGNGESRALLVQRAGVEEAVAQLMSMSGTTHELVNGLVLLDTASGRRVEGVDVQVVTMARFDEASARRYVEEFRPFESAGSYRIEDQDRMAPGSRLLLGVQGEHESGVRGLPLPLLGRMLADLLA